MKSNFSLFWDDKWNVFLFFFFLFWRFVVRVDALSESHTHGAQNRKEWCQKRKDKAQKKKRSYLCPCLSRMKDETLREFDRWWRVCVCVSDEKEKVEIKRPPPLMLLPPLSLNLPLLSPSFLPICVCNSTATALSLIYFFSSFGLYKRHLCAPLCVCVCVCVYFLTVLTPATWWER